MKLIIKRSFSGKGFSYADSYEPQEVPSGVAEMAIEAGFAAEVKPAKKTAKAKKASKAKAD